MRASLSQLRLVLRSMRCRSLSRVRVSASCLAGDSCIEVRSEIVGMRLVCHDLEWHADRACHEKCTDCTTKSKAVRTADAAVGRCSLSFAERVMQELVQGPRRLIQAFPGPSESESRKPNAFAPTASVQESRELSARAVGDELRRIVALTIQKQARSPCHDAHAVAAFLSSLQHVRYAEGAAGVTTRAATSFGGGDADRAQFSSVYPFHRRDHTAGVVSTLLLAHCCC